MADLAVINALRRFVVGETALTAAYQEAFTAYQNRQTTVTITASNFEGGNSSGQIAGDPKELMEACEFLLKEIEAEDAGETTAAGPYHSDFSKQPLRT